MNEFLPDDVTLEQLCDRLPVPGVDIKPELLTENQPLVLLRRPEEDMEQFVRSQKLGEACAVAAEETDSAEAALRKLIKSEQLVPAMNLLAALMPAHDGLWWATRFAWDVILDDLRASIRPDVAKGTDAAGKAAASAPDVPKPANPVSAAEVKEATASVFGPLSDILGKATSTPEFQAAVMKDPSIVSGAAAYTMQFHSRIARLNAPPPSQIIPRASGGRKALPAAGGPGIPRLPDGLAVPIELNRRRSTSRALACALQWVVHPCQKHAEIAREAAESISKPPLAKSLSMATFWCGENLNKKKGGTVIPPSPGLRLRGIRAVLTKALAQKGGIIPRGQRPQWALNVGIRIAQGRENWDSAMPLFAQYSNYIDQAPLGPT